MANEHMLKDAQREIISFKLNRTDLAIMGKAVGKLQVTHDVDPDRPGAFMIRNHSFSTDQPGAFTIRNYSFDAKAPGAFTIRNYQFSSTS